MNHRFICTSEHTYYSINSTQTHNSTCHILAKHIITILVFPYTMSDEYCDFSDTGNMVVEYNHNEYVVNMVPLQTSYPVL